MMKKKSRKTRKVSGLSKSQYTKLKYRLYEKSVQSPKVHIDLVEGIARRLRKKPTRRLREDFCGTFLLCCEWVKRNPNYFALGLDLDPEPVQFGKIHHYSQLSRDEKKRLQIQTADVRIPTTPRSDLIIVGNFSFFIFQDRKNLIRYFKSCLQSLSQEGLLILELAGGPGMITASRERRTVRLGKDEKALYVWHQKSFDPILRRAEYAIHFRLPSGTWMKDAFTYDWRLWTIPEIRDALADAGFKKSFVYWETDHQGEGTGEYALSETGDNAFAWIAYIVGMR
jgi:hypothetical protein